MSAENVFSSSEMQMVTFNLGGESFGIDIMNVQEIIRMPAITRVPHAPNYVEGVTNLRGAILPVIDTRTKFSMEKGATDGSTRVIVVDAYGKNVGLNVDSVSEVLRVDNQCIEEAPASLSDGVDQAYLTGVVKIQEGKKLVMILDVASLCNIDQQAISEEKGKHSNQSISNSKETAAAQEIQLVSFLVGQEEFGLEIDQVKEIIRYPEIVKTPNVPNYIKGIISLRDTLMPIVDLRIKLELESDEITDNTRVVVVEVDGNQMGLTVDKVYEVIRVPQNSILPPPQAIVSDVGERITGIVRLDGGNRIIMLMDLNDIINGQVLKELKKQETSLSEDTTDKELQEINEEQMVVFRLAGEQFGVSINQVQEINRLSKITKVPRSPSYIEGVVNLRGDVIPVIDLRKRFELESKEYNHFTRIIVSDINKKKVGIIVDEVLEVLRVSGRCMEEAPEIAQEQNIRKYLEGIANLTDRMIMMLNLENILQANEWQKVAAIVESDASKPQPSKKLKKQGRS